MPEQYDRWHRPSAAELKQRRAEHAQREAVEEAARKEALQIVERWKPRTGERAWRAMVADDPGRCSRWNAVARCVLPWLPHRPRARHSHA
jgi:hypothetical protein